MRAALLLAHYTFVTKQMEAKVRISAATIVALAATCFLGCEADNSSPVDPYCRYSKMCNGTETTVCEARMQAYTDCGLCDSQLEDFGRCLEERQQCADPERGSVCDIETNAFNSCVESKCF